MPVVTKQDPMSLPGFPSSAGTSVHTAFEVCKALEKKDHWSKFEAELKHPKSHNILHNLTPVVAGRVLGYGLLYLPSDGGKNFLAMDILACKDNEDLAVLAHLFVCALLGICMSPPVEFCLPSH